MDIHDIIDKLQLSPLTGEGGMFRRTWLSEQVIAKEALSVPYTVRVIEEKIINIRERMENDEKTQREK